MRFSASYLSTCLHSEVFWLSGVAYYFIHSGGFRGYARFWVAGGMGWGVASRGIGTDQIEGEGEKLL